MAYLGVPPQSGFITTAKQRITSSTNNYVDLDHSISSLADVIVWVNFVKQDSTNLTLTTSSRITLGATLVASDIVEIAYLGKAVATQTPSSGTVTNDMLAGSIANSKLANSSITLNGSAVSLGGSATVGGDNTPYFYAYNDNSNNDQLNNATNTVIPFQSESFDSGSKFNTSTYRFTPAESGYYFLKAQFKILTSQTATIFEINIRKNGTEIAQMRTNQEQQGSVMVSTVAVANTTDYFDVIGYQNTGFNHTFFSGDKLTNFMGFKLIT